MLSEEHSPTQPNFPVVFAGALVYESKHNPPSPTYVGKALSVRWWSELSIIVLPPVTRIIFIKELESHINPGLAHDIWRSMRPVFTA